ncbi:MAG: oligosaccharide flippase family protein [Pseudomonadota bacterium]
MNISKYKKNAIFNILGWLLPTVIFLLLTPYMINKLGVEGFGVVTIIQVVTGYMAMFNFGFSEAIIKSVAENHERDDNHVMRILLVGFVLFICVGLLGGLIIYFISDWLVYDLLQVPDDLKADASAGLKIGSLIFFLQMIAEFYRGSAIGCQRFDIPNISRIIRISISGALIVLALSNGGGIESVMEATLIGLLVGLLINIFWMNIIMPMKIVEGDYKVLFLEIFHFSKHIFSVRLTGMISNKISHFFLGSMSSVANIALYEIPVRVGETGAVFMNRVLQVMYPSFSKLKKDGENDKIENMINSILSIQLLISLPVMLMFVLEAETLLAIWINADFAEKSSGIILLVAITYLMSSLTNIHTFAAMSFDMPSIVAKYNFIRMIITLILVYPSIKYFGLIGAASVLLISALQSIPFIYEVNKRIFGKNIYVHLSKAIIIHTVIASIFYVIYEELYKNTNLYHPAFVILFGMVHFLIVYFLGVTSEEDNARIKKLLFKS